MTTQPANQPGSEPIPPEPARALRLMTLLCSLVLGASVLPVLYVTLFAGAHTLWFSTLFELTVLAASGVGLLTGLGRFREGWALALTCVAGTVLVTAVFARVEIRANFGDDPAVGRLINPIAGFRLALAVAIGLIASAAVWNRDRRSWAMVIKAAVVLLPVAVALAWLAMGNAGFLNTPKASPGAEAGRIAALILGGLFGVILVSGGGHLLIRAYELGRLEPESPENAQNT